MECTRKEEEKPKKRMPGIVEAGALAIVSNVEHVPTSKYDIPSPSNESFHYEEGNSGLIEPMPPSPNILKMPSAGNTSIKSKLIIPSVSLFLFATITMFVMWKPLRVKRSRRMIESLKKGIIDENGVVEKYYKVEDYVELLDVSCKLSKLEPNCNEITNTFELIDKMLTYLDINPKEILLATQEKEKQQKTEEKSNTEKDGIKIKKEARERWNQNQEKKKEERERRKIIDSTRKYLKKVNWKDIWWNGLTNEGKTLAKINYEKLFNCYPRMFEKKLNYLEKQINKESKKSAGTSATSRKKKTQTIQL